LIILKGKEDGPSIFPFEANKNQYFKCKYFRIKATCHVMTKNDTSWGKRAESGWSKNDVAGK